MIFTPVRTRRTFEAVINQIAEAIRAGDLGFGERLPSERELARQMEISRPTLREAIRVLVEAAVIEVKPGPGGGMFVRSDFVHRDLLEAKASMRVGEISEVLEARRLLEPRVAQLAAVYATDEDFEIMQKSIDDQRRFADDRDKFLQLDLRFHLAIARATRNSTIVAMMAILLRRLEIARELAVRGPHNPALAIEIHERTLKAIQGRDPDVVDAAMDEHMSFLEKIWEAESGRGRLRKIPDFLLPHPERASVSDGRPARNPD
jgi:GntR family transcriptional repressor for pyruvate dehydrogenase complex